ncbi:MAG: hypothetical protein V1800_03365 [Candidatus Latescibacterota bacterium]
MGRSAKDAPVGGGAQEHSWRWAEDLVIVLAVLTLWPTILGWSGLMYRLLEIAALVMLVGILVRRIGRFRAEKERLRPYGSG